MNGFKSEHSYQDEQTKDHCLIIIQSKFVSNRRETRNEKNMDYLYVYKFIIIVFRLFSKEVR